MLDVITKNVKRIKVKIRKGVIPKKMKVVIVLDDEQKEKYIVQTRYFDQLKIKRPGRRIMVETELAAASRLIELAVGIIPQAYDVAIVDSQGSGTNKVSYVFWFAPTSFDIKTCSQLHGLVLSLNEQLSLDHEFLLRAEARITADLFAEAVELRAGRTPDIAE